MLQVVAHSDSPFVMGGCRTATCAALVCAETRDRTLVCLRGAAGALDEAFVKAGRPVPPPPPPILLHYLSATNTHESASPNCDSTVLRPNHRPQSDTWLPVGPQAQAARQAAVVYVEVS